ncbi:MAG TPA: hypothetical protein VF395_09800, partial [Polyangiaceae bacterium]
AGAAILALLFILLRKRPTLEPAPADGLTPPPSAAGTHTSDQGPAATVSASSGDAPSTNAATSLVEDPPSTDAATSLVEDPPSTEAATGPAEDGPATVAATSPNADERATAEIAEGPRAPRETNASAIAETNEPGSEPGSS